MWRPSRRTVTSPTSCRTRKCLETEGCSKPREATISPTGRSSRAKKLRISRRRGSATALKASEVVEARGMVQIYTHIGICQGEFFGANGTVNSEDFTEVQRRAGDWFVPGVCPVDRTDLGARRALLLLSEVPEWPRIAWCSLLVRRLCESPSQS